MRESEETACTRVPSTQPSDEALQRSGVQSQRNSVAVGSHHYEPSLQPDEMAETTAEDDSERILHGLRNDSSGNQNGHVVSDASPSMIGNDGQAIRDVEMAEEKQGKIPNSQEKIDPNIVDWDGPDDPRNPMNWTVTKKWVVTISFALMTFCITFASSVFSTATQVTAQLFAVSEEVMILGTSLFVLVSRPHSPYSKSTNLYIKGFSIGPILWGPISELYGRTIPLFTGFIIIGIFQVPVAVAQNVEAIMLCRFLGGVFASAPLAVVGGALVDFWNPVDSGVAIAIFSAATFIGPIAGPIVSGFVTESYLGWRWTAWILLIMSALCSIGFLCIPETYAPALLQRKAKKTRFETKSGLYMLQQMKTR